MSPTILTSSLSKFFMVLVTNILLLLLQSKLEKPLFSSMNFMRRLSPMKPNWNKIGIRNYYLQSLLIWPPRIPTLPYIIIIRPILIVVTLLPITLTFLLVLTNLAHLPNLSEVFVSFVVLKATLPNDVLPISIYPRLLIRPYPLGRQLPRLILPPRLLLLPLIGCWILTPLIMWQVTYRFSFFTLIPLFIMISWLVMALVSPSLTWVLLLFNPPLTHFFTWCSLCALYETQPNFCFSLLLN